MENGAVFTVFLNQIASANSGIVVVHSCPYVLYTSLVMTYA